LSRRRIPGRNIISDVRSGMSNDQLMDKYQLSPKQLDDVLAQILTASTALAKKISEDIRQEMIDSQLMKKYQLSREGLSRAFEKLLEAGFIDQEAFDRCLSPTKPETTFVEKRHRHRRVPYFPVTVVDRSNPRNTGRVKDISAMGLGVVGMQAQSGENKSIAILGDDLGVISPFELRAECRWVVTGSKCTEPVAGFQIRLISERDLAWLEEFIEAIDLGAFEAPG
jgi:hypothetical protein